MCAVARVPSKDDGKTVLKPSVPWMIHQYSWKGKIDGINGDVDLDICNIDYPDIIQKAKLNGYGKSTLTAIKRNLSDSDAKELMKKCKALGMTVKIE